MNILEIPAPLLIGQLLLGVVNGSFYAILSMGLAVIFGLLGIVNMAHGALFMLGAWAAWALLAYLGIGYWPALVLSPALVAVVALLLERVFIRRMYQEDHTLGLVMTIGLAMIIEGILRNFYGSAGMPYAAPDELNGAFNTGFMLLPRYRVWVVVASLVTCTGIWLVVEKTRIGALLRAAMDNPTIAASFGIDVPRLTKLTFGFGAALAAFAGVLAAPIYSVHPMMGSNLVIVVFAIVVIGGMGSIRGAAVTALAMGVLEAFVKLVYSPASTLVIFLAMAAVLQLRPQGLFTKGK